MLVHVGLNLVVEIFHDALERFGERFLRVKGIGGHYRSIDD